MDDSKFFALAVYLHKITLQYQLPVGHSSQLKHHVYVAEYDKAIEQYGLTKKQFVAEVKKRLMNKK